MKILEILAEKEEQKSLTPPTIKVGDEVKVGKFKNRKAKVKGFAKDKHNQPVLKTDKGDQKLFKPRITKLEESTESGYIVKHGKKTLTEPLKSKSDARKAAYTIFDEQDVKTLRLYKLTSDGKEKWVDEISLSNYPNYFLQMGIKKQKKRYFSKKAAEQAGRKLLGTKGIDSVHIKKKMPGQFGAGTTVKIIS